MAGYPGGYQQQGYGAPPQQGYGAPPPQQAGVFMPPGSGVDPQVASWFQTVDTDRSGRITSAELQQALTNTNWSHFNPETCRLMVGMFDRDHSGTIDIEFSALWTYIHQWKGVFDQFDRDRSGAIESTELQNAFNQMGYRLSLSFSNLIVTRYDIQSRSRLTLDNFIQACVLLKSITDTFRGKDAQGQGVINVNYEDFMTMAMLNKP